MSELSELPSWLQPLFSESFFNACLEHPEHSRNETNILCLDCGNAVCPHCLPDHLAHKLLQIRRYMYRDVVRLSDAAKLMPCARVQAYTSNGERVAYVKPKPHKKKAKNIGGFCEVCKKGIQRHYFFCSLTCKLDHMSKNGELTPWPCQAPGELSTPVLVPEQSDSGAEMCSTDSPEAEICSTSEAQEVAVSRGSVPSCRAVSPEFSGSIISRRRKSTPTRSPLY